MAKSKKVEKALTKKELFDTLTVAQRAAFIEIVGKVALREDSRHYLTKKEVELRKDMTGSQCRTLDAIIKALMGIEVVE